MICAAVFLLAFGVRVLTWHDTRLEVGKVQTAVADNYKTAAQLFRQEGVRGFFSSSSPLADTTHLGHPPGYSILIAAVRALFSNSDTPVQFLQITFDALSAVVIFLIVVELFGLAPAVIAGLFAAFAPQFAWNSVLLLPDTLAVFPILLAVYLLVLTRRWPRLWLFALIGALVGLSCWLRANALLLTLFFAAAVPLLVRNKLWWRFALAVIAGTVLIVLPLTLRNAIVFHRFIPVSLGAGQTLLEGIADYDEGDRFNIPRTDLGIMKQEADAFHRPDYYDALLSPDGIDRERWRLQRGFKVIRSHPAWFASVMMRRAVSMVRLERARLVSPQPTISTDLTNVQPSAVIAPSDLLGTAQLRSPRVQVVLDPPHNSLQITGDESPNGPQVAFSLLAIAPRRDCVVEVPVNTNGRFRLSIRNGNDAVQSSAIAQVFESKDFRPVTVVQLPFISGPERPQIEFATEGSISNPTAYVEPVRLYDLGPARFLWTRYPRFAIHEIQKLIITAVVLPLAVLGVGILVIRKRRDALIILAVVPLYFLTVQSIFHTEYRYVLAVTCFLFVFAAVTVGTIAELVRKLILLRRAPAQSSY